MWWFHEVRKVGTTLADICNMIISEEQALLAARQLAAPVTCTDTHRAVAVSDDLIAAARAIAEETPDTRDDRISEARAYLGAGALDAREVASKMISRIISDSLR